MPADLPAAGRLALGELLDTAPCGFVSFTDDGTITAANATLARMLGYEPGELDGARLEQVLAVGTRIFYHTHFFPLVRLHGHAEEIFLILRGRDGADVAVLANAVRRERGGVTANDCVLMRVRERRRFEDELLRARRDAEQARAEAETHAAELHEANRLLEDQAVELEQQHQMLQEQAAEMEEQAAEMHVLNDALLERAEELERARAAAEQANRAKSTFLAVMSHELRTPLNAIGGYAELLEMGVHGPVNEAQLGALERIIRGQRHLLSLINDVLDLARIESGRVDYVLEAVELARVLEEVVPLVEPQAAARGLHLAVGVEPGAVAWADREKVRQIVINLLGNAIKFTPPGGRIRVDAARRAGAPGRVYLRVEDTGPGIDPAQQAAVFEPFVQVDMSSTRSAQGSGLGLAISRDLARGMGGDLRLRSRVGEGSVFTLALPRAASATSEDLG